MDKERVMAEEWGVKSNDITRIDTAVCHSKEVAPWQSSTQTLEVQNSRAVSRKRDGWCGK